jgi:protein-disulfide isomerase
MSCMNKLFAAAAAAAFWLSAQAAGAAPGAGAAEPERGVTAKGLLYVGSPDAPVTLEEWSDYGCPYCARHFRQTFPRLVTEYVAGGRMRIVFHDFPIVSLHPAAPAAHAAAACVAEQGAGPGWAMHDALFEGQQAWSRLPDPGPALATLAAAAGADPGAYAACLARGESAARVAASVAAGQALGFSGTPTFRVIAAGGPEPHVVSGAYPYERFAAIIDALLAGKAPPPPPEPPKPELPAWATPAGLQPDPARPGYTAAGDPFKGSPQAPVTVVEFSDFQCPACATHALEVQPEIDEALVATGRVRWVYKHLPLRMHPYAALAAVAAECAGEQRQFWPMHDELFRHQQDWADEQAEPALRRIAASIGLDAAVFDACLAGRHALERVLADLYDSQGITERTPSFVMLPGDGGGSMSGSMPAKTFIGILEKLVAGRAPPDAPAPTGSGP